MTEIIKGDMEIRFIYKKKQDVSKKKFHLKNLDFLSWLWILLTSSRNATSERIVYSGGYAKAFDYADQVAVLNKIGNIFIHSWADLFHIIKGLYQERELPVTCIVTDIIYL